MAELARKRTGREVAFEISVRNVDKPDLPTQAIVERASQFKDSLLFLTRASRFTEKSQLFPGAIFIAGADTLCRLVDPRYYEDCSIRRDRAIEQIAAQGCRFLFFGRMPGERFLAPDGMAVPDQLVDISEFVPESVFRMDVSSSEIRRAHNQEERC